MRKLITSIGERESRLLAHSNLGEWAKETLKDRYLVGPYQKGDAFQMIGGPPMAAASVILEGTDQLWGDIIGQKIDQPRGIAGRTRRDIGTLVKDVFTLHPLRAAGDVFRLAFADVPLDAGDALFGFHTDARRRMKTALRSDVSIAA